METSERKPRAPFRRSRNKVIAGVCAGCADWLRWDPTVGRFFFSLITVMSVVVPGIIVYLLLWTIMPKPAPGEGPGG
ncbi:hypothetical protein GPROT2_01352 [Gammaproteobacteria bacterium]|nr:PspC domain-containing protein [Gammaproteobacteria bacterium]QOJ32259.1 MAG: PspC domain-containing protein [Gammaproteobacteria bacterium]CAG0941526.1 hypothetical protein GPROT2_01352 [Gammaproteobacteria bacterium]